TYLASIDWPGARISSVPPGMIRGYQENSFTPVWSPDGKSLAYVSILRPRIGDDIRILEIRAVDTEATRELPVKVVNSIGGLISWSPDGRYLMVTGNSPGGNQPQISEKGLYRVDANTGEALRVLRYDGSSLAAILGPFSRIDWLPD